MEAVKEVSLSHLEWLHFINLPDIVRAASTNPISTLTHPGEGIHLFYTIHVPSTSEKSEDPHTLVHVSDIAYDRTFSWSVHVPPFSQSDCLHASRIPSDPLYARRMEYCHSSSFVLSLWRCTSESPLTPSPALLSRLQTPADQIPPNSPSKRRLSGIQTSRSHLAPSIASASTGNTLAIEPNSPQSTISSPIKLSAPIPQDDLSLPVTKLMSLSIDLRNLLALPNLEPQTDGVFLQVSGLLYNIPLKPSKSHKVSSNISRPPGGETVQPAFTVRQLHRYLDHLCKVRRLHSESQRQREALEQELDVLKQHHALTERRKVLLERVREASLRLIHKENSLNTNQATNSNVKAHSYSSFTASSRTPAASLSKIPYSPSTSDLIEAANATAPLPTRVLNPHTSIERDEKNEFFEPQQSACASSPENSFASYAEIDVDYHEMHVEQRLRIADSSQNVQPGEPAAADETRAQMLARTNSIAQFRRASLHTTVPVRRELKHHVIQAYKEKSNASIDLPFAHTYAPSDLLSLYHKSRHNNAAAATAASNPPNATTQKTPISEVASVGNRNILQNDKYAVLENPELLAASKDQVEEPSGADDSTNGVIEGSTSNESANENASSLPPLITDSVSNLPTQIQVSSPSGDATSKTMPAISQPAAPLTTSIHRTEADISSSPLHLLPIAQHQLASQIYKREELRANSRSYSQTLSVQRRLRQCLCLDLALQVAALFPISVPSESVVKSLPDYAAAIASDSQGETAQSNSYEIHLERERMEAIAMYLAEREMDIKPERRSSNSRKPTDMDLGNPDSSSSTLLSNIESTTSREVSSQSYDSSRNLVPPSPSTKPNGADRKPQRRARRQSSSTNPLSGAYWKICGVPLPHAEWDSVSEEIVAAALGYTAIFIDSLARSLQVHLRYELQLKTSRSTVIDTSGSVGIYPLYLRGSERARFDYAVHLLNKDIECIALSLGLRLPVLRETLPNLAMIVTHIRRLAMQLRDAGEIYSGNELLRSKESALL